MTPAITIRHLSTQFGVRSFVYDFALDGPQIVAVTGPSGSGKSTLFHLIAGFEAPRAGTILLNGLDMAGVSPGKRPLTYIFQDHNLFAHLDVRKNVALGLSPSLRLSPRDDADVGEALAKVGLSGFERRMPEALSGGERQRVAFARALVRKRPFLLLDEAFGSLDEELRADMGELLKRLQAESGMMVLMISHDRREVVRLASRVIEVSDGSNVYCGETAAWAALEKNSP
jgi:thiamine transport system ATP-binding protein